MTRRHKPRAALAADLRPSTTARTTNTTKQGRTRPMPSKSPAQHRLMEAVAHDPKVAKQTGVPQSVGQEFAAADEAKAEPQPTPKAHHTHRANQWPHKRSGA